MIRPSAQRLSLAALLFLVPLAGAGAVRGAEPSPSSVAYDATVLVAFDPSGAVGGEARKEGATVTLQAVHKTDERDVELQTLTGRTDRAGHVTFTGVARHQEGTQTVIWELSVRQTATVERGGCVESWEWAGYETAVATSGRSRLEIGIDEGSSSHECPSPSAAGFVKEGEVLARFAPAGSEGQRAGGTITLTARQRGAVIQTLSERTDSTGTASFEGVAVPVDGAPPVSWQFDATLSARSDEGRCWQYTTWSGSETAGPGVALVTIEPSAASSSIVCPEPEPTGGVDPAPTEVVNPGPSDDADDGAAAPRGRAPRATPPVTRGEAPRATPALTPPATDTSRPREGHAPLLPVVLLLGVLAAATVLATPNRLTRRARSPH